MQPDSQLKTLIETLKNGPPRTSNQAGQELIALGQVAEAPLISLLQELKDPQRLHDILVLLQQIRLSEPASISVVLRCLQHAQRQVRASAATCLLHSSPRLRPFLSQIESAQKREKDARVRALLQKLLDRYPG